MREQQRDRNCKTFKFSFILALPYKKLSCCRETARYFVSLNISLSHSRSLEVIRNGTIEYGMSMGVHVEVPISIAL